MSDSQNVEDVMNLPDEVRWVCLCGCVNVDLPAETSTPVCADCGDEVDWADMVRDGQVQP